MTDDNEENNEPAVELGEGEPVDGEPLARVASRLTWAQEKSEIVRKEGSQTIRTPDGPKQLADVLDSVDETYFATRSEFEQAVRDVIGVGPVPTANET